MKKKVIFVIILVILFLILIGIYNISNHQENRPTNQVNQENVSQNEHESVEENGEETNIQNVENGTNLNQSTNSTTTETGANTSTTTDINTNQDTEKTIVNQVSPSGFMGSSLYRVILYSNGEVYLQTFDGNGYEQGNIISQELIAKNANSIKAAEDEEHYGEVIIQGGEAVNREMGWISFE